MSSSAFNRDARGRSPLQQEQVERTRQKILDGLVRVLNGGVAGLSVPAVAREAGVSVPTVYRYYKSKEELLRGLAEAYEARLGGSSPLPPPPADCDRLGPYLRALFLAYEEMEPALRTVIATGTGSRVRRTQVLQHLRMIEDWLDAVAPDLSDEDHVCLRDVIAVLTGSATQRAFKDYLDLPAEEAARLVTWAMRQLVRAAQSGHERGDDALRKT